MCFEFCLKYISREHTWRCYIVSDIYYGNRDYSSAKAHWLSDHSPYNYICWSKPIKSRADAEKICDLWSEATERYIRVGGEFGKKTGPLDFIAELLDQI